MRIILIIQTIIIAAAAWYIYTLRTTPVQEPMKTEELPMVAEVATATPVASEDMPPVATNTDESVSAGPNDAGMEWPTIEMQ